MDTSNKSICKKVINIALTANLNPSWKTIVANISEYCDPTPVLFRTLYPGKTSLHLVAPSIYHRRLAGSYVYIPPQNTEHKFTKIVRPAQIASLLLLAIFAAKASAHGFIPVPLEVANALDDRMRGIRIQQPVSTFPSVDEDISTVLSNGADMNNAFQRLMKRGSEVLEPLHKALDKATTNEQKRHIISLLGFIADNGSIPRILKIASETRMDEKFTYALFGALNKFERTSAINEYMNSILGDDSVGNILKQLALLYYADKRYADAAQWIDQYNGDDTMLELRKAALVLAARTGDRSAKNQITRLLSTQKIPVNEQRIEMPLLKALIEITTNEEFSQLTMDSYVSNKYKEKLDNYRQLYSGSSVQRAQILQKALENKLSEIQEVVDVLIRVDDPKPLTIPWVFGNPIIKETVHKHGLSLAIDEHGARFVDRHAQPVKATVNRGQSPKAIADTLITSLKNNDIELFNTISTLKEYEVDIVEGGKTSKKVNGLYRNAKNYSEYRSDISQSWHDVIERARKNNIDWNTIENLSIDYKILVGPYRMQITDIDIRFESNKGKHRLQLMGIILFDEIWRLTIPINWVGSH